MEIISSPNKFNYAIGIHLNMYDSNINNYFMMMYARGYQYWINTNETNICIEQKNRALNFENMVNDYLPKFRQVRTKI